MFADCKRPIYQGSSTADVIPTDVQPINLVAKGRFLSINTQWYHNDGSGRATKLVSPQPTNVKYGHPKMAPTKGWSGGITLSLSQNTCVVPL